MSKNLGQKHNGTTVNATISVNAAGEDVYNFNDSYNISVDLSNTSGLVVDDTAAGGNDQFLLHSSSGDLIKGGNGNDTFVVSNGATDLGGNVLQGGLAFNVVQLNGSGTDVDLTQGSNRIDAVIGHKGLTGETVEVKLSQIGVSARANAGVPGNAFVALIGADGVVNVSEMGAFQLVGVMNAAGQGYAADGTPLDAADTATLAGEATSIGSVLGTVATDYSGNHHLAASAAAYAADNLNAYVFSDGTTSYTVWTDGSVVPVDKSGNTLDTAYQPAASKPTAPVFGTVSQFNAADTSVEWASATLGVNSAGITTLKLADGDSVAYAAVLVNGVGGTVIHGDSGQNGGDWFGLGKSAGGNKVVGSAAGDIFDLQNATSLADMLNGGIGLDVVRVAANGADVDLTANNANTGVAAKNIDAVVGSAANARAGGTVTVEVNLNSLGATGLAPAAKVAEFAAMLGSSSDTLTLEGTGAWLEVAAFKAGDALPNGATALNGGATLDAIYGGSNAYTAETDLNGYVFEAVGVGGKALKYVTVYTDATVVDQMAFPQGKLFAQAMAAYGPTYAGPTTPPSTSVTSGGGYVIAPPTA